MSPFDARRADIAAQLLAAMLAGASTRDKHASLNVSPAEAVRLADELIAELNKGAQ